MSSTATRTMREVGLISLSDIQTGADSKPRSWVMLLPEGKFSHHTYGEIDLSRKALDEMARHFHDKVRGIELALDYDHKASEGDSRAPGWLEDVEYRAAQPGDVPAGLWGKVRWTSIGLDDVRDERYRYISAEFKPTYKDELSGRTFHNVLIGATLTNRPFMKQMPAIALSQRKFQKPGQYTAADRKKIDAEDFAGPHQSFPIVTQQDVHDAARLIGHADDPAAVKARIKAIAKRKGFSLPAEWEDEDGTSTAASETTAKAGSGQMALDERESQFDPEDETDDASEEDFEEQEQEQDDTDESEDEAEGDGDGDEEEAEEVELADSRRSGKSKSSQDDDNDESDEPDADEDDAGEALDDSEEYAEEDDADAEDQKQPMPQAKTKRGGSKKMSETDGARRLTEDYVVKLEEEVKTLREEKFRRSVNVQLAEFGKAIRLDDVDEEEQLAIPRSFKEAYRVWMLAEGVRLSEKSLSGLNKLFALAFQVGVVDLSSKANKLSEADDLDDRRPRPAKRGAQDDGSQALQFAESIAREEHKKPLSELTYEQQEAILSRAWSGMAKR